MFDEKWLFSENRQGTFLCLIEDLMCRNTLTDMGIWADDEHYDAKELLNIM